jgi:hypothetical protein
MNERLLQFIWQHRYFNREALTTSEGLPLQIIFQGDYNTNQGPDFLQARITVDGLQLAGTVELHLKTSDWMQHGHSKDEHYSNVILHVVWEHDAGIDKEIHLLELKGRVSLGLVERYKQWMNTGEQIPCGYQLQNVSSITWLNWKERMAAERLLQKKENILQLLQQTNQHWEECFWQLIARNFGNPVNSDAFQAIAQSIPLNTLAKHKNQIHQLEAFLLGQAGLLNQTFSDPYAVLLQKEYLFLQKKYRLKPIDELLKFLRMRPSNFPTIRLAQLAMLIHQSSHLFSKIIEATELTEIKNLLAVTANDFWNTHYTLSEVSVYKPKQLGAMMLENIFINTIIPILFVYGAEHKNQQLQQKALNWLQKLPREKNKITGLWEASGAGNQNAFDSQALLYLKKEYCNKRKCLSCSIGNAILKKETVTS